MLTSLKDRRRTLSLSRQTVATRAWCSVGMVAALEQGYRPNSSTVLPRVEAVLAFAENGEAPAVAAEASQQTPGRGGTSDDQA